MTNLSKEEWYKDRILWRANQHKLFDKRCCRFEDLPRESKTIIAGVGGLEGDPVIVFWENEKQWTALTTCQVVCCLKGDLNIVELDEIDKQITIVRPSDLKSGDELKREVDQIHLKKSGVKIWAPAGSELFALMNILRMFPLGVPSSRGQP